MQENDVKIQFLSDYTLIIYSSKLVNKNLAEKRMVCGLFDN